MSENIEHNAASEAWVSPASSPSETDNGSESEPAPGIDDAQFPPLIKAKSSQLEPAPGIDDAQSGEQDRMPNYQDIRAADEAPPATGWSESSSFGVPSSAVEPDPILHSLASSRSIKSPWTSRVTLLLVAALVGGVAGHFTARISTTNTNLPVVTNAAAPASSSTNGGLTIPQLVVKVQPSVVSIDVKGQGTEDQGTGMIISSDGLVLTNNHVIAASIPSGTITVTRTGSTQPLPATLIGTNPVDDVALIRISGASNLPAVTFGNSNALVVGDSVVAIGNALGLAAGTPTVTNGIVSALGRTVTASSTSTSETLNNMIQTDAAINPGNSGGPLLDAQGDVVGMNTAVAGTLPDGTSAQNIGFAIPVATIESLLKSLQAGQSVVNHGAFMGVDISSMNPTLQAEYNFTVNSGAVVMSVVPGSGAANAGIKQGDIIVAINGTAITSAQDVSSVISSAHPGDTIKVKLIRGSQSITTPVILGTAPAG
ncbi:MAG: PDZ domain-containing protein [Acidimicrobiaceae bacterium]|nr:PDZ domain-containing protein [Acidimicrobiaceae bacterium]